MSSRHPNLKRIGTGPMLSSYRCYQGSFLFVLEWNLLTFTHTFVSSRMLMVCTTKYDILATLTACLEQSISCEQPTDMRRSICLIFNNLSIPFDNKAVMVLGPSSRALLLNLLNVILFNLPEAYLCCICLMNLSILHDAKDIIFYLSQNEKSYKKHIHTCISPTPIISDARTRSGFGGGSKSRGTMQPTILDDSMSLIRGLERLMKSNSPFLVSNLYSVEGEAVRWSVGLLRSFTKAQSYCNIICNTTIPMLLVEALKSSPRNVLEWTTDSLEEMALICLCDLVRWPIGREVLQNTSSMLDEIAKVGGIHGYRASVISSAISMREV